MLSGSLYPGISKLPPDEPVQKTHQLRRGFIYNRRSNRGSLILPEVRGTVCGARELQYRGCVRVKRREQTLLRDPKRLISTVYCRVAADQAVNRKAKRTRQR